MKKIFPLIFIILIIFVVIVVGVGFFYWNSNVSAVNPKDKTIKKITIQKGQSIKGIAIKLQEEGLVKNDLVFTLLVKQLGLQNKIQAGEFSLSASQTASEIAESLTHGTSDSWITVPEGWRNEEIAEELNKEYGLTKEDFLSSAQIGYMFPDTYLFPKTISAQEAAMAMRKNFDKQILTVMSDILTPGKKVNNLTLPEIVNLAAIVEREGKNDTDRPLIAGVLLKRMQKDWPLEVDATLQYILGYDKNEKKWWRNNITADDLTLDSRYNTRKFKGLPPTPICNPGLAALKAVLYPRDSEYWFYLSDKTGKTHFAKTIEEHNSNVNKYLSQ